ncbi:MAG: zinc-ribbon domain-containing protein, partial [Methylococcales bacterium]|nr:zinc-ribbon domain-containing protein [Methylococcales bacterium]
QLFITIVIILLLGKLITLVPVMHQLQIADTFTAAEIIWFLAKLTSLVVFFLFARFLIEAIPNNGGALSFVKGVAEPLTVLLIAIMGQALLWQMLAPFVDTVGRTVYNSTVIILIVCVSVWFVLRAYRHSLYIVNALKKVSGILSRYIPQQQIICDHCHAEISTNATFCSQCGHKIQKSLCCPECGERISEDQSNCQNCGSKLNKVTALND